MIFLEILWFHFFLYVYFLPLVGIMMEKVYHTSKILFRPMPNSDFFWFLNAIMWKLLVLLGTDSWGTGGVVSLLLETFKFQSKPVWMCECWQACSGTALKVSPSKYAEHGGLRTGAEGEHGVAELIYLMTERLISSPALIRIHAWWRKR